MPGAYLAAILFSAAGIAVLDWRLRLAFWSTGSRARTIAAVATGTVVLLLTDVAAIALGVFVQGSAHGESSLYVGLTLAPELPVEELFFLAFLCYLAIVIWRGAERMLERRAERSAPGSDGGSS